MTEAEKQSAVETLAEILTLIEVTRCDDGAELLRLAALASYQLNRLTAEHK